MNQIDDKKTEFRAIARNVRISPHKLRKVIDQVRGRSYEEALILLTFMPYKGCKVIEKVLRSGAANANHNFGIKRANLYISKAIVDQGPAIKRFRPRAQGRGYPIRKPISYITVVMVSHS